MMYYIEMPKTWRAANRKCGDVLEFIKQFEHCLIASDLSLEALIFEIRHKVDELNKAYPRTKKLVVTGGAEDRRIYCFPEGRGAEYEYVFIIDANPVRRTYQFAESSAVLSKGDAQ